MRFSTEEFDAAVEAALDEIPEQFRPFLENVSIEVQMHPSQRELERLGVGVGRSLLGLYIGRPLTARNVEAPPAIPDRIILFRANLQHMCTNRRQLIQEIRTTVLHEVGHHFGLGEDDLRNLGY